MSYRSADLSNAPLAPANTLHYGSYTSFLGCQFVSLNSVKSLSMAQIVAELILC